MIVQGLTGSVSVVPIIVQGSTASDTIISPQSSPCSLAMAVPLMAMFVGAIACIVALLTAVAVTETPDTAAPPKIALGAAVPVITIGATAKADFRPTQDAVAVTAVAALAEVIFNVSFVAIAFAPIAALAVALAVSSLLGVAVAVTAVAAVAAVDLVIPAVAAPAITLICAASAMPI